uniref:Zinc finger CCCH domain-containing protein 47 n=1 Tax=Noccaea caerulescens TaxID=107243 RepID=A0A1J3K530_NOCCA
MCSGPKSNLCSSKTLTETELKKEETMGLLEFAACDDLQSFKREIEERGLDLDEPGLWYCRRLGSKKKMGLEERTPLMVAAMYGSIKVLSFIISSGKSDVNRACGEERVTALHCAVAGCSVNMIEVIKSLLDGSALANSVDANGNQPFDLFVRVSRFVATPRRKAVELLLRGGGMINEGIEEEEIKIVSKYPADASLPDINEGVYGSDEFRMYSFKVKPCSRAYSHDWTECAFVHPGENARRRDPRKYPYTCVPCPEFRKGSCPKGDSCEYAHGVFESWLHPAQYKTRLCKDETGCARKVCFFAHRREEMRPVNASTGSAAVSQSPFSSLEMMMPAGLSPLAYSSSGVSTPPVSPMASSPRNGGSWQNRVNTLTPPALQLNGGSRLKSTLSARDMDIVDMEMEMRLRGFNNVEETFGSYVSSSRSQNMNQHYPSSPVRQQQPPHHGFESSAAAAVAAVMNARSSAFAKRSLSFKPAAQTAAQQSNLSDWGSPSGKLEWGMQGEELNKMRRSVSFGIHGNNNNNNSNAARDYRNEPDVSWVNSLVKDNVVSERGFGMNERVRIMSWAEQMYRDKEQTVA